MRRVFFGAPAGKSLNIIEKKEGLILVDTSFAPINRGSLRPGVKKMAMTASSTINSHGGHVTTMVPNTRGASPRRADARLRLRACPSDR